MSLSKEDRLFFSSVERSLLKMAKDLSDRHANVTGKIKDGNIQGEFEFIEMLKDRVSLSEELKKIQKIIYEDLPKIQKYYEESNE